MRCGGCDEGGPSMKNDDHEQEESRAMHGQQGRRPVQSFGVQGRVTLADIAILTLTLFLPTFLSVVCVVGLGSAVPPLLRSAKR